MSNVLYIDANAKHSTILTEENNRYRYTLPNTLLLPTGTQISAQSSVINLQGITGASIEIEEDIEEEVIVQYYIKDTYHEIPRPQGIETSGDIASYQLYDDLSVVGGGAKKMGGAGKYPVGGAPRGYPSDAYGLGKELPTGATYPTHFNNYGYSEINMPMVCGSQYAHTGKKAIEDQYAIPMCGKIRIKVEKGIYSISKIAQLITDQMNAVELPYDDNKTFVKNQQLDKKWTGFAVNGATSKRVECLTNRPINLGSPQDYTSSYLLQWYESGARPNQNGNPQFESFEPGGSNMVPRPFETDENREAGIPAVGVHPQFASFIRKEIIKGNIGTSADPRIKYDTWMSRADPDQEMFRGFSFPQNSNVFNVDTFESQIQQYNTTSKGVSVGAAQFTLDYDTEKNGFSINYLHTPRFIPSFDIYGGKFENPGNECVFMRRAAGINSPTQNTIYNTAKASSENIYQMANRPMSQTTGIQVLNWAHLTTKKYGDRPDLDGTNTAELSRLTVEELDGINRFRTYDEWFSEKADAKAAWENTLWARLGFTYDDLQNPEYFEENLTPSTVNSVDFTSNRNEGFTTDQDLDTSSITTISTQFNALSHSGSKGSTEIPPGGTVAINANISEVQAFNTQDVNAPFFPYNNNANKGTICVFPYKGSLFGGATMFPVVSKGKSVVASALPVLSNDGYIMITSDLVELDDVLKDGQYLGLLDLIPKSNLSNQDYVSDRNQMVHTLSNPKTIDDITINIIDSNLKDVALRPNSTILLKIVFPMPKPTIVLASQLYNEMEQQVIQTAMASAKQGLQNVKSKNEEDKDNRREEAEHPHARDHSHHEPVAEPAERRREPDPRAGGGAADEGRRRSPSPQPTPEALRREAEQRSSGRLRPRGERGRYRGVVPPRFADEVVVASGGRETLETAGSQDSGVATASRSASAPPRERTREGAPEPRPTPPRD